MKFYQRLLCCVGSLILFGAAAAAFILLSRLTHADTDAEIVGWSVLISLSLAAMATYLAYLGLRMGDTTYQFVVLHHTEISEPHFDVMVEATPGGPLMTWRSPCWPFQGQTALTKIADHRRAYLTFEGELTDQRGSVSQVDRGTTSRDGQSSVSELWRIDLVKETWVGRPAFTPD